MAGAATAPTAEPLPLQRLTDSGVPLAGRLFYAKILRVLRSKTFVFVDKRAKNLNPGIYIIEKKEIL